MFVAFGWLKMFLFFLREHHDFGTKVKKSETDSKGRPFFCFHSRILDNFTLSPKNFSGWFTYVCLEFRLFSYGNPNLACIKNS